MPRRAWKPKLPFTRTACRSNFRREAVTEAESFGHAVSAAAKRGREDLRDMPLVTIDGEDARDFDDAVWCEAVRGGWRLIVAIADVASYVEPDSALDQEAQHRGTSVYFPNRVLPMLPEALSNGLCSLNPQVDRLCLCCEMKVDAQGKVTRARFFEGLMRSAARLTYTKVAAYLANPAAVTDPEVMRRGRTAQAICTQSSRRCTLHDRNAAHWISMRRNSRCDSVPTGALRRSSSSRATMRIG